MGRDFGGGGIGFVLRGSLSIGLSAGVGAGVGKWGCGGWVSLG